MQKKISFGGLGCALAVIFIAMSAYLPTLKAATLFMASLVTYIVVVLSGRKTALIMYLAVSVLIFLICQAASPTIVFAYIICFGNYPALRDFAGRYRFAYLLKTVIYILYFVAVYFVFTALFKIPMPLSPYILGLIGLAAFFAYDYLLEYAGMYFLNLLSKIQR